MRHVRRGATLVEILVAVLIVGTLVSILIPALRAVMIRKHDVQDLSNLRLTMQDFYAYAADNNGRIVNRGLPGSPESDAYFAGSDYSREVEQSLYRGQEGNWNRVLSFWRGDRGHRHHHSSYEDFLIERDGRVFDPREEYGPNYPDGYPIYRMPTDYRLSETLLSKHEMWRFPKVDLTADEYEEIGFKIVSIDDVKFPAAKGALIHDVRPGPEHLRHVAFVDGSAALKDLRAAKPTACPPTAVRPDYRGPVVKSTMHGYRGHDF